jgi:hypothetical protein
MTYQVSYDGGMVRETIRRTEYYRTEFEALRRARQLPRMAITTASPFTTAQAAF